MYFPTPSLSDWRLRYSLLALALIASIAPFWATTVPPSTDLPQHLGQIYLLEQTVECSRTELMVTPWFYPNTLIYAPLYALWKVADPVVCGRMILSTLAVAWLWSTWLLCAVYRRPVENWLVGAPLVFNFLFSWGL